jgi:hypothetical protein
MDLVNIGRSRRFLRERPIRVNLFDRPRLVCDLICLESEQTEKRRGLDTSDSLYVVIEGNARLRSGQQIEELEAQDTALIPPGVDHTIENLGPGRLTVMVVVTPKPSRAGEVRMPVQGGFRSVEADAAPREENEDQRPSDRSASKPYTRERRAGPTRGRPYDRDRNSGPPRGRPYGAREDGRGAPPREGTTRRDAPSDGTRAGGRAADRKDGPVWFPRPKQSTWRPRGAPPAGGRGAPRGASGPPTDRGGPPSRTRSDRDERESLPDETPRRRSGFNGPPPTGAARGGRPPAGGRGRGAGSAPGGRPGSGSRGGGGRGSSGPARRPTGRPAPGRSGSRTSGRRRSPES